MFHALDILLTRLAGLLVRIVKSVLDKEFVCRVGRVVATVLDDLPDDFGLDLAIAHGLHHCKMLEIIVRLKQRVSREELDQDATDRPDITGKRPA